MMEHLYDWILGSLGNGIFLSWPIFYMVGLFPSELISIKVHMNLIKMQIFVILFY